MTLRILWWYSDYTYFVGEVLMQSGFHGNIALGCADLAKFVRILAALCAALLVCLTVHPQGNAGRILGVVTDQSGGNVANATVTITDVARGVSQTLTTDSDGVYVAIN
ncbi:MAG TPA: carboxypeptidase-like regulatory domain-containing protein, partial [Candidatus Acidoferrum sp.]|nr:carboxypeptidase-like regulatory domain-containing protein [Candidatus Acidoferrum sp.]